MVGNKKQRVTEQSPPKMDSTEVMFGTKIEIMHEHDTNATVTDTFLYAKVTRGGSLTQSWRIKASST